MADKDEFDRQQRRAFEERVRSQSQQLADEVRICTRCGWKIRKSEALAAGVKACPACGNTECVAQSMDFNLDPRSLRSAMNRPQGP